MTQGDLFEARAAADLGMQRAVDHADAVMPNWSDRALKGLIWYARQCRDTAAENARGSTFMVEDARECLEVFGLPKPPDGRAWGAVVQRAARAGAIVRVGWSEARSSNNSPKGLWSAA